MSECTKTQITENQCVKELRETIDKLNNLLYEAAGHNLRVEIEEDDEIWDIGRGHITLYRADIFKRL